MYQTTKTPPLIRAKFLQINQTNKTPVLETRGRTEPAKASTIKAVE
jgi:hypothetical protein